MNTGETKQRDPDNTIDVVLRSELWWEAPPDLTKQLLSLVDNPAVLNPKNSVSPYHFQMIPPGKLQPGKYYSLLVLILTCVALWISLSSAWQFYDMLGTEFGLNTIIIQIQNVFHSGLQQIYQDLPAIHYLVELVSTLYEKMYWLLNWLFIAVILWLALDGFSPGPTLPRQQLS